MPGYPRFREQAKQDLVDIIDYLGARNPNAAERFVAAVKRDASFLVNNPGAGGMRTRTPRQLRGLRSWPVTRFKNYLIFYVPVIDGIEVVRVLHGARNIGRALRETQP